MKLRVRALVMRVLTGLGRATDPWNSPLGLTMAGEIAKDDLAEQLRPKGKPLVVPPPDEFQDK